ncbi:polysaccharide deacetylase family protein [Streptomyces resistomycificus]|uniref:Polysaccharide deacetylase n=1 Tax=Streptomyces resistomycificus TaxID=67356 RepID=A0A0L8L082_9ACTN|nr:polysaccharide deacetylase family protein [Streptomyces resistomycificus]KOG31525.1 polysaccharide deacetylase [Streptomyces resistomycificus]KUN93045.1 polysaccharide deacetylase [Streptomyces resistomycificus]
MTRQGLLAAALAAVLLTGCAWSGGPLARPGGEAAERTGSYGPGGAGGSYGPEGAGERPYRRWGLAAPLTPAPKPAARPSALRPPGPGRLPVLDRVRTPDRVVFLTYDDGAEKDPHFVDLVRELRLPVTMFLTDSVVGPGYGHFARLRSVGASIQNHTLDHPALRGLPYAGQRAEICGQQDKLRARFGVRPRLFRPPYGTYDTTTLRAARDCGLAAVVLWRASARGGGLTFTEGERGLRAGDIVSVPSGEPAGPTLTERTTRLLREIQRGGLTVGRLEDYL